MDWGSISWISNQLYSLRMTGAWPPMTPSTYFLGLTPDKADANFDKIRPQFGRTPDGGFALDAYARQAQKTLGENAPDKAEKKALSKTMNLCLANAMQAEGAAYTEQFGAFALGLSEYMLHAGRRMIYAEKETSPYVPDDMVLNFVGMKKWRDAPQKLEAGFGPETKATRIVHFFNDEQENVLADAHVKRNAAQNGINGAQMDKIGAKMAMFNELTLQLLRNAAFEYMTGCDCPMAGIKNHTPKEYARVYDASIVLKRQPKAV